jgi:hypothetical protein
MVQCRCSSSVPSEALQGLRVFGEIFGKEFQCDKTAEFRVLGLVNNSHAAATEFLHDAVMRDGLADECVAGAIIDAILGCEVGQVTNWSGMCPE